MIPRALQIHALPIHSLRIGLAVLACSTAGGVSAGQTSVSTSGPAGPAIDPCWPDYIAHMKECKDVFCPNVLLNCDSAAYADCRATARASFEHCHE